MRNREAYKFWSLSLRARTQKISRVEGIFFFFEALLKAVSTSKVFEGTKILCYIILNIYIQVFMRKWAYPNTPCKIINKFYKKEENWFESCSTCLCSDFFQFTLI